MAMEKLQGTRRGAFRAYTFGIIVMFAAFLFGYDTGVVGGVLELKSFTTSFNFSASDSKAKSLAVGLQQLGAFFSTLFTAQLSDRYGRKWVICGGCLVFCIGIVLQVVPSHMLRCLYAGRIVAGLGLGVAFCTVPVLSAEMAPRQIRGQLGSFYQWLYAWGILVSYWIDYAVIKGMPSDVDAQWQIPIGFQMIPAAVLGIGVAIMPESARWLMKVGREEEAWKSLSWIRADDGDEVRMEFGEIRMGVVEEQRAMEGFRKRELLEPANRKRFLLAAGMFMNMQLTGATALAYFGPQFFASIAGNNGERNLLITALFGVIKVIASTFFILFLAERFSRRKIFITGALCMSACMLVVAVLNKEFRPSSAKDPRVTSPGIAMVAMIFLDIAIYNLSWGPLPHPYATEIFPTRTRAIGVAVGCAVQWLFNYLFSTVTPYMIDKMQWGTFLFYACTDIWSAGFVYFLVKETRGKSLEEMDTIFESRAAFDVQQARMDALDDKQITFEHAEGPGHTEEATVVHRA